MFGMIKKAYKKMGKQSEKIVEESSLGLGEDVMFEVTFEYGEWCEITQMAVTNSCKPLESLKLMADSYMVKMTGKVRGGYVEYASDCGRYMGAWVR